MHVWIHQWNVAQSTPPKKLTSYFTWKKTFMFLIKISSFLVWEPHLHIQGWYFRGVDWKHDELHICLRSLGPSVRLQAGFGFIPFQAGFGWATHFPPKKKTNPRQVNVAHRIHVWYLYTYNWVTYVHIPVPWIVSRVVESYMFAGPHLTFHALDSSLIHPMNPTTCC